MPSKDELSRVKGVFVGHSHFDHAMELPIALTDRLPENVVVDGSQTLSNLLAPVLVPARRRVLDSEIAGPNSPGRWIDLPDSKLRVLPIASDHAHLVSPWIYNFEGEVEEEQSELPVRPSEWKAERILAYLIDVRRPDGSVAFRMHYQDATSNAPSGFPPRFEGSIDRRVDVAVLVVSGYVSADDYPGALLRKIRPRHALLSHWELIYGGPENRPNLFERIQLKRFIQHMEPGLPHDAHWTLPERDLHLRVRICAEAERPPNQLRSRASPIRVHAAPFQVRGRVPPPPPQGQPHDADHHQQPGRRLRNRYDRAAESGSVPWCRTPFRSDPAGIEAIRDDSG
jgi:hypothetical protein